MALRIIFVVGLSFALWSAPLAAAERKHRWILDTGVHISNLDQRLANFGAPVSTVTAYLRVRRSFTLKSKVWFFEPSIATTLPWRTNIDGNSRVFTFQLSFDLVRASGVKTRLRFGPGVRAEVGGSYGESVSLNNGTGTATFYTPETFVIANSLTLNAGIEYALGKNNSLVVDVVVPSPFSSRRRFHASAALGWNL